MASDGSVRNLFQVAGTAFSSRARTSVVVLVRCAVWPLLPSSHSPQPLIAVNDVEASSEWFQQLLGAKATTVDLTMNGWSTATDARPSADRWDVEHHHASLGEPDVRPWGHGVLLWFEVEDFDAAVARAQELGADIELGPFPSTFVSTGSLRLEGATHSHLKEPDAVAR